MEIVRVLGRQNDDRVNWHGEELYLGYLTAKTIY